MSTVIDKSGIKFETLSQELTLSYLADEVNIKPKEDYPLCWYVGNKVVSFGEIEDLYKLAKLRKEQFEENVLTLGNNVTRIPTVDNKLKGLS